LDGEAYPVPAPCGPIDPYRPDPPADKSIGKIAEEYNVPYSLVYEIDARIRKDYDPPADDAEVAKLMNQAHEEGIRQVFGQTPADEEMGELVEIVDEAMKKVRGLGQYAIGDTVEALGKIKHLLQANAQSRQPKRVSKTTWLNGWIGYWHQVWKVPVEKAEIAMESIMEEAGVKIDK